MNMKKEYYYADFLAALAFYMENIIKLSSIEFRKFLRRQGVNAVFLPKLILCNDSDTEKEVIRKTLLNYRDFMQVRFPDLSISIRKDFNDRLLHFFDYETLPWRMMLKEERKRYVSGIFNRDSDVFQDFAEHLIKEQIEHRRSRKTLHVVQNECSEGEEKTSSSERTVLVEKISPRFSLWFAFDLE
jgi:hypothetical protein